MAKKFCCPKCGSENLQAITEMNVSSHGKDFSGGKGCLGFLLFGPLGLLCGACGKGKRITTTNTTYWICHDCGHKFRDPSDVRKQIIGAVIAIIIIIGIFVIVTSMISYVGDYDSSHDLFLQ